MTAAPAPTPDPVAHFRRHVLSKIGLRFADDGGGAAIFLEPAPMILDADGHVDVGVLGLLFDLASSTAFRDRPRPFVHADIGVQRFRPPNGTMLATASVARQGTRTGIVEVELRDRAGALVAASTQEIVFRGPPPEDGQPDPATEHIERVRSSFHELFDGTCQLGRPLREELGIRATGDGGWAMDLADDRTNGFAALHGGTAVALVDAAAEGAVAERWGRARTVTTAVRYLRPATVGPFVARPEVRGDDGALAVLRVPVVDTGADDQLVILAEAHVTRREPAPRPRS